MLIRRPIVILACCWLVGTYLAHSMPLVRALIVLAGLCFITPILLMRKQITIGLACMYVFATAISIGSFTLYDRDQVTNLFAEEYNVFSPLDYPTMPLAGYAIGQITTTPERDGDRVQFELQVHSWQAPDNAILFEQVDETILVQVKLLQEQEIELSESWTKGLRVRVGGELSKPQSANHFGGFDYPQYLKTKHIYWLLASKGALEVTVEPPQTVKWSIGEMSTRISVWLESIRQGSRNLYRQLFDDKESAYLEGLVLGLRSGLDPELENSFAQLGLTHVLAISGLHVAVFVGACLLLLRPFRLTKETSLLIVVSIIPIYVLFTGASPSVIRAGVMSMLALIGLRQGWLKDGLHLLSAALLLMLWWEPYYALDVSFQLSFAVTAGLIIGVPSAVRVLPARWPMWLRSSLAVNVVAQLVSFPLTIYYFNQVSFLSLLTNIVLVPFISFVVLPLGTVVLFVSALSISAAAPIAWLISRSNAWTFGAVDWLAKLEGTTSIWPTVPIYWLLSYYVLLGMCMHIYNKRSREWEQQQLALNHEDTMPLEDFVLAPLGMKRRWWLQMAIPISLLLALLYIGYHDGKPRVTSVYILDVGQGDSTLIRTASGRNILIDGGGTLSFNKPNEEWKQRRKPYEVGASRIVPLLKQRGVRRLDAVVLSHGDNDHAGGLRAVLSHIPTDRFIMNGTWKASPMLEELFAIALDKRIPVISWSRGDYWQLDPLTRFDVWSPSLADPKLLIEQSEQNEASLVLLLSVQPQHSASKDVESFSMLFTGDMTVKQERNIVQLLVKEGQSSSVWPERIHLLKVAHHGSKTSSSTTWLNRFRPYASTISAGRGNRYGHPNPDVMERLLASGSMIYRTDEQGELQFRVTGRGLKARVKHDSIAQ